MALTHLSLFSGIGGIDLAAEWAGFETVGQCEWADYPTKVLEKHWPDVPRWRDIRTLTGESFYERTKRKTVDLVSGGFPCQPFSVAGKQRGHEDDRYLWPEMLRVIQELQPCWVLGENVAGIINLALDQVLFDLENIGYENQAFVVPACAVDAQHRRDRVFIVAHTKSRNAGRNTGEFSSEDEQEKTKRQKERIAQSGSTSQGVPNAPGIGQQGQRAGGQQVAAAHVRPVVSLRNRGDRAEWPAEPDVGRVAHGIPNRVDRLKCLGNAVVPQQVYPILKAIAELEAHND